MPTLNRRRDNTTTSHKQGRNFRDFYQSSRWHTLSRLFRKANPLCKICKDKGHTERSEVVDHIIPLVIWVDVMHRDPYDTVNMQALSKRCHSIKTKEEQNKTKGYTA